jgi:hypothetical protein
MGLNLKGTNATNYFGNDSLNAKSILASQQDYADLISILNGLYDREEVAGNIDESQYKMLIEAIDRLYRISPSDEELQVIDTFTLLERTKFNRDVETLIKIYNIPSKEFFNNIQNALSRDLSPDAIIRLISIITKNIGAVGDAGDKKLLEFKENILKEQQKLFDIGTLYTPQNILQLREIERLGGAQALQDFGGIERLQEIQNLGKVNIPRDVRDSRASNLSYIKDQINLYSADVLRKRIVNPNTQSIDGQEVYGGRYFNHIPTIDLAEPNEYDGARDNVIYYSNDGREGGRKKYKYSLANGQEIKVENGLFDILSFNPQTQMWEDEGIGKQDISYFLLQINRQTGATSNTHTVAEMKKYISRKELPILEKKITDDAEYRPRTVVDSRIVKDEYDADNDRTYQGWGVKEKKKTKKKGKKYDSDSSSDEMRDIHIDINSHNGKNYKMSGDGFIKRRIKIGKGIEIKKDEPKFRAFGKYIIHMPQLYNQNVLNFKHKSGGSIPSIKPVNVDDNFKDFVLDVLESGKVNDRHYESLTDAEKNHFLKVVRGAGIINDLKLKNSNDDKEKEDIERLQLLIGEYNAGNDNANMIKEAKTLIKKYVSNGRISRQKGLEMLMEFD